MELETVLSEYSRLIWHIINNFIKTNGIPSHHADDIYQEACIRLFTKLKTYEVAKSSMKTFVATNTEIVCVRYRRQYFRHDTPRLMDVENIKSVDGFEETYRIIDEYETTELHKKVIYQKLFGYTQQEIAKQFKISQSTVSRILSEFRDHLVERLKV